MLLLLQLLCSLLQLLLGKCLRRRLPSSCPLAPAAEAATGDDSVGLGAGLIDLGVEAAPAAEAPAFEEPAEDAAPRPHAAEVLPAPAAAPGAAASREGPAAAGGAAQSLNGLLAALLPPP